MFSRAMARMTRTGGGAPEVPPPLPLRVPMARALSVAVVRDRADRDVELEQLDLLRFTGGVQPRQYLGAQLLRRDQHAAHAVLGRQQRELVEPAEHRDAVNPLAALARIIVEEAERLEAQRPVVAQLAHRQLAAVARPVDRHGVAGLRQAQPEQLERAERRARRE